MPNVIYTVRPDGLLREADSIERSAKENQKSWIMLGQLDKYNNAMQEARLLRRAAAEKSVYTRREILRNAGYTVKTPKALSKNPKTRNIQGVTMATKKFSPAQIAAQKLFAERARAGTLKKDWLSGITPEHEDYDIFRYYLDEKKNLLKTLGKGKRKPNPGLYENINAKRKRIAAGSGERMRKPGSKGAPTQAAFEQSAMTAKRNPDKSKPRAYVMRASQATGRPPVKGTKAGNRLITRRKKALSAPAGYFPNPEPTHDFARIGKPFAFDGRTWKVSQYSHNGKTIEAYTTDRKKFVRREFDVSELMMTRRKTNPRAAMMTGYQVICMHPKKHVVGIFKTMAEAKLVARAMADAKGVPYAVKTVKVHKSHFAV